MFKENNFKWLKVIERKAAGKVMIKAEGIALQSFRRGLFIIGDDLTPTCGSACESSSQADHLCRLANTVGEKKQNPS